MRRALGMTIAARSRCPCFICLIKLKQLKTIYNPNNFVIRSSLEMWEFYARNDYELGVPADAALKTDMENSGYNKIPFFVEWDILSVTLHEDDDPDEAREDMNFLCSNRFSFTIDYLHYACLGLNKKFTVFLLKFLTNRKEEELYARLSSDADAYFRRNNISSFTKFKTKKQFLKLTGNITKNLMLFLPSWIIAQGFVPSISEVLFNFFSLLNIY